MTRQFTTNWFTLLAVLIASPFAMGGPHKENEATAEERKGLTVAVLGFDAKDPGNPELGNEISEMLSTVLSGNDGFDLVDRSALESTLREHELSLTGMVAADQAVKVGRLVGAQIMVTGRAFPMGEKLYITAKLIGTETSRIQAIMASGAEDSDLGELVMELAQKVNDDIGNYGVKLTGADLVKPDPVPALQARLAKVKRKSVIAIVVSEEHIAGPRPTAAQPLDPAVETELKVMLGKAGFTIKDVKDNELANWAREANSDNIGTWPQSLEGVDVVITGEALSEFGSRTGNLVSCVARAEINLISRKNGEIVLADRTTTRAVDLGENIAGKTALQKAGHALGIRVLQYFSKEVNGDL